MSGDESESAGWRTPMTVGAGADTGGVSESVSGSLRVKDRSGTGGSKSLGVGKEKEKEESDAEVFENVKVHPPDVDAERAPSSGAASSQGYEDAKEVVQDSTTEPTSKEEDKKPVDDDTLAQQASKHEDELKPTQPLHVHIADSTPPSKSGSPAGSKTHTPRSSVDFKHGPGHSVGNIPSASSSRKSLDLKHVKARVKETVRRHRRKDSSDEDLRMPGSFVKDGEEESDGGAGTGAGTGAGGNGGSKRSSVRGDDLLVTLLKRFKLR